MKMRKLFAGLAAAATLLSGLALGATTASAAEPQEETFGTTVKVSTEEPQQFYTYDVRNVQSGRFNTNQDPNLRDFKYVKLASYEAATQGTDGKTYGVRLVGNNAVDSTALTNAFNALGYNASTDQYNDKWTWFGNQNTFTAEQLDGFRDALKDQATTVINPVNAATGKELTFDFSENSAQIADASAAKGPGLYLIVDVTTPNPYVVEDSSTKTETWTNLNPILIGTYAAGVTGATGMVKVFGQGAVEQKSTHNTITKGGAIQWQKTDKDGAALAGATFQVYEGDYDSVIGADGKVIAGKTPVQFVKETADGTYRLPLSSDDATVQKVTDLTTTGANGTFTLNGLPKNTTYTVVETKAPTGYADAYLAKFTFTTTDGSSTSKPTFVGKDAWNLADRNSPADNALYKVKNVQNISQLPLTGAAGTILFSVVGVLLAAAAGTVFLKSRSTKRALRA